MSDNKEAWREHLESVRNTSGNGIKSALAEWALNYDYAGFASVVEALEGCDYGACFAPSGLIYNHDLAEKVQEWWVEINDALDAYEDATGERYGVSSIGQLVWFAVEWTASEMAAEMRYLAQEEGW